MNDAQPTASEPRCRLPNRRRLAAGLLAAIALAGLPVAASERPHFAEPAVKIEIRAQPIQWFDPREPMRVRFGALEFLGGIELSSDYQSFGGISGLHLSADGAHFLALTDRGRWLRGRIVSVGDRPMRIEEAEMAPILGADGRPLAARGWYDTESLTADDGHVYVGIERVNQIVRFDYGRHGLLARGQPTPVPPGVRELPRSQGLEALAFVPRNLPLGGTLIAISERGLDAAGNIQAFLIGGPSPGAFSLVRSNDYDVTDAAITPAGNLLVLERRFTLFSGASMRIRRIPLSEIKPGATIEGTVLIEAERRANIDNMEALAVHKNRNGDTVLTIISDDNFNPLQRTLLLRFALAE